MSLNLDDLIVDTFPTEDPQTTQAYVIRTVLYETEQVSCGGTCQTCDCWA